MKRSFFRSLLCVLLLAALSVSLCGCGDSTEHTKQTYALGTTITLTAYGSKGEAALSSAVATISAVDAMCDPDVSTSTCYALNNSDGAQVNVSGQIAEMLLDAQEIYKRTDGAYDITCYPLVELWGFSNGHYYVPSTDEIYAALDRLCMGFMSITKFPTSGTYAVVLPSYGKLSFDSCARGCASKYAIDAMYKNGVTSGIVSCAGNVQTLGTKPDGSDWSIGITDPANPSGYLGVLSIGETAVCTTGGYQNSMPSNSSYHHIFNLTTGNPTSNGLLSVTVVGQDGTYCDCLSTAMYALGYTKAMNYWRTYGGFDMIFVTDSGSVICTSGLLEQFELRNTNYTLSYAE